MSQFQLDEEAIFDLARQIDSADAQAQYLDQACGEDQRLKDRIVELLENYHADGSFLERPPEEVAQTIDIPSERPGDTSERPGDTIGPYKLLQKIGEGGFGVVYMAEQHRPVRRKVALKVIKPGMDTKEVIGRFEAERQALAMMDHPNIAKVLDAGTTESRRPYFVMELVRGIPITEYCDNEQLGTRERLELFAKACQAVQHAHQKGVIHRDIKPSNVLITEHDGSPVPKVIDFGVAKAINQQLTEHTVFTRFQQMIGTPMYMSPEQAALSGLDIDTRSDIYSLGVLLYELLTGTTPFDKRKFKQAAYEEIRRIIREEEPPKPSTKVSTMGDESAQVAGSRKTDIRKLRQAMRGELDWIVMKALEKDRKRRYETANGFAMDIRRYLDGDAVQACPPSTAYLFRKFIGRHRVELSMGAVLLALIVSGIVGTTWQAYRATRERDRAVAAEGKAISAEKEAQRQASQAASARMIAENERTLAQTRLMDSLDLIERQITIVVEDEDLWRRHSNVRQSLLADVTQDYQKLIGSIAEGDHSRAVRQMRLANVHATTGAHRDAIDAYRRVVESFDFADLADARDSQRHTAATRNSSDQGQVRQYQKDYIAVLSLLNAGALEFKHDSQFRDALTAAEAIFADWLGRCGQWELAVKYFQNSIDRQPDDFDKYRKLAPMLVFLRRNTEYENLVRTMLEKFASDNEVVRFSVLTARGRPELERLTETAKERLSELDPSSSRLSTRLSFDALSITLGAVLCRSGEFRQAVKQLDSFKDRIEGDYNPIRARLYLVMALVELGEQEKAKLALSEADKIMAFYDETGDHPSHRWYRRLELDVLRREAVAMLESH